MIATRLQPSEEALAARLATETPDDALVSSETIALWSGVACLYAGTATALAYLWSPV